MSRNLNLLSLNDIIFQPKTDTGSIGSLGPYVPVTPIASNCSDTSASLTLISNTGTVGSTRTQIFKVGCLVQAGFTYSLAVYSYTITVTAINGDTPFSIVSNLINAVNGTSAAQWNSTGSAATGKPGFPPTAAGTTNSDEIQITLNYQNQFAGWASGSLPPPPPPAPANQPPIANAGSNQTIKLPVNSITLDGSQSYDPENESLTYNWTMAAGPNVPSWTNQDKSVATVSDMVPGHYTFKLTVTDPQGANATAMLDVDVLPADQAPPAPPAPANQPPIANTGSNQTIKLPVSFITLDGSQSYDPENGPLSFMWKMVEGPNPVAWVNQDKAITTVSDLTEGHYAFQLTVMDSEGASSNSTVYVSVKPADIAQVINTTAPVVNINRAPYVTSYGGGGGGGAGATSPGNGDKPKGKKTNWLLWLFVISATGYIIFGKNK